MEMEMKDGDEGWWEDVVIKSHGGGVEVHRSEYENSDCLVDH